MTKHDIRIAALEEAASLAESIANNFGGMAQYAARFVARKIRAQMTLEIEEA